MKVLWLSWKDVQHPLSGGAEVVANQVAKRVVKDGGEVIFLTAGFDGGKPQETIDGSKIIRLGNRFSVYWKACRYYKKNLVGWADVVIDEMNTVPFFAKWYVNEPAFFLPHQLCRQTWFYQVPFPLSVIGYLLEPVYLWLLRGYQTITVSESTKQDLQRFGFRADRIHIIPEGLDIVAINDLNAVGKYDKPTLLAFGAVRGMKRTTHSIKTFEIAKQSLPDLKLKVAGKVTGRYGQRVLRLIERSRYRDDIEYLGKVSRQQRVELMRRSHLILVTSVKEGWGLIVTEAASQGTPAVVYNIDGLRDSVRNRKTGIIVKKNTPAALAAALVDMLNDQKTYARIRYDAWQWSKEFDFDKTYQAFKHCLTVNSEPVLD